MASVQREIPGNYLLSKAIKSEVFFFKGKKSLASNFSSHLLLPLDPRRKLYFCAAKKTLEEEDHR